jgi:FlgD Ig-like domain
LSRLPVVGFALLAVATVAAFFVTQHLKVTTPLIAGSPRPVPSWINPADGRVCAGVDHRRVFVSFYLLHRSDDVDVYIVDQTGAIVRTIAQGRHMRRKVRTPDGVFTWNGRNDDGQVVPDGTYYFRVALVHQGRTVEISDSAGPEPIQVRTIPPRPVVTKVSPALIPRNDSGDVLIRYTENQHRSGVVRIWRTDLAGKPKLVKSFVTAWNGQSAVWDGKIDRRPAPPGTYLVGLDVTDAACNTGGYPIVMPPAPGTTHTGVTVRYLAAEPPLRPVPAGSTATVYADARQQPYRWALRRAGSKTVVVKGSSSAFTLDVKLPSGHAGMYQLALRSGPYRTVIPIVASLPTAAHRPKVLVVLPALTWQGLNPVDDDGDGLPNTLAAGGPISLNRPLANGFPPGAVDEAGLLAYLDKTRRSYDVTTDLGLLEGFGPTLAGHSGVVLAGSELWLPASLQATMRAYVQNGGHVMSLGIDSLRRSVTVAGQRALHPTRAAADDAFGAALGPIVAHDPQLITVIGDRLGIFKQTSGAFPGFHSYQPVRSLAAPGKIESSAGATTNAPAIVGYDLGRGVVVDVGLLRFGSRLAHDLDAQELVDGVWKLLSK